MALKEKPKDGLVAASCHTRAELYRDMRLDLDFAVLGPVLQKDHRSTLGWNGFAQLARGTSIPFYAIGGLTTADLEDASRAGAHCMAMIRGSWS
jgi:8-oxo-dGTP diphosphatase